jgi:small GTP-binding protein
MSSLPIVAIVGRPNVGKSTLFNRMVGERAAIVEDTAGTTRDRVYGETDWNGRRFMMVDTGGLELEPGTSIEERVQDPARVAIDEADLVLLVVDAAAGLAPLDYEVADRLRKAHRPTILVINKADNVRREAEGEPPPVLAALGSETLYVAHGSGEVLALKTLDYIEAARALGAPEARIIARHLLPNLWTPVIILSSLQVAQFIVAEAAISFLGFGVQPPTASWGNMLNEGKTYIYNAWWMTTFPGLALVLTALGVNLVGDWLRDTLDPRLSM